MGSIIVFTIYPLINEETPFPCQAVEKKALVEFVKTQKSDIGSAIVMSLAVDVSQGGIASGAVKSLYPNIPPFAGCYVTYYKMALDPPYATRLVSQFSSKIR